MTGESLSDTSWAYGTATDLAGALAARKISALELTDYVIARIEALDGRLNAVVVRDFERARTRARALDNGARADAGPLFGVPMTVKESFLES